MQIQPPIGGLSRKLAYQSQPPFTCYDALNVWPREPGSGRVRMGSRPGLVRLMPGPAEAPWRLFETINIKANDRYAIWWESFSSSSLSHYTTIPNVANTALPTVVDGMAYVAVSATNNATFMIPAVYLPGFDATASFRFGIALVPFTSYRFNARLYFGMPAGGDANNCYYAEMAVSGTIATFSIKRVVTGTTTTVGSQAVVSPFTEFAPGWLEVEVHGTDASIYWRGSLQKTVTLPAAVDASIPAMGVYAIATTGASLTYPLQIDHVQVEYHKTTDYDVIRPILVASQNGLIYRNDFNREFTQSIATRSLASDHRVLGADFGQLKFLADWSYPIASGGDGTLGSGTFSAASVADFSTTFSGKNIEDYVLVILSETGQGTYPITAASTSLTITGGTTATNATWWIMRSPKVYDPIADGEAILASGTDGVITGTNTFDSATYSNWETTFAGKLAAADLAKHSLEILSGAAVTERSVVSAVAAGTLTVDGMTNATGLTFRIVRNDKLVNWLADSGKGTVPVGCSIIATYRGAIYLAGDPTDPNEWYKSRNGDPYDWKFSDTDAGAATKGSNAEAYRIGDVLTAMIPYADHFMLMGCRSSIWRMTDDVTDGGEIAAVNRTVGIASATAWCHGENGGQVFFLSPNQGVWATQIDCPTCDVVRVSGDELPREFQGIGPDIEISMTYDIASRGVHISLTPRVASESVMPVATHWWLDLATKGLFPAQFADKGMNPVASLWYAGVDPDDACVLFGCYDGAVRRYSMRAVTDGSDAINSYVLLGPFMLGEAGRDCGILAEMIGNLTNGSANVTWSLYVGNRAEGVVSGSAVMTGTFTALTVRRTQPRRKGGAFALKLSSTSRWAFESVDVTREAAGGLR